MKKIERYSDYEEEVEIENIENKKMKYPSEAVMIFFYIAIALSYLLFGFMIGFGIIYLINKILQYIL